MFAKMDVWFSRRKVQKAMAKTRPKYLARSPVSIRRATKFMRHLCDRAETAVSVTEDAGHPLTRRASAPHKQHYV
jgi:hypothetical protein